ncbi:MAG: Nramp family divalent metal transporter [Acidobacteriota bacterium]
MKTSKSGDGEPGRKSLSEIHGSVAVPFKAGFLRRILAITGPAYLVSVGYMDPGNWATDLAAGSRYNYTLIWVLLLSNLMAVLLQSLSARLGIVRGLDLAQACRVEYPRAVNLSLYGLCELAIAACDLAEVLGSAIALQLLFGMPLLWGVLLTAADTLALLFLSQFGIRKLEALILSLVTLIGGSFLIEIVLAKPEWGGLVKGFVPSIPDTSALFIAIGMLGATVMPHNLYLHSSLVQTRKIGPGEEEKRQSLRLNTIDSAIALNVAFFVNAAILVMAAAVFYRSGHTDVAEIQDAHRLLEPILGAAIAPVAFAVALLASGQSSTITGTLAGQIVMEGFLNIRIPPWLRRLITRLVAIAPAVFTLIVYGEEGTGDLLVLSQVVLSLQLPFAIVPLIHFVSDRKTMGVFAIGPVLKGLAWLSAVIVVSLNLRLVTETLLSASRSGRPGSAWILAGGGALQFLVGMLLVYVVAKPWVERLNRTKRSPAAIGVHAPTRRPRLEEAPVPYRKVAVAMDFSGREETVLREAIRLFQGAKPHLALIHVVESAGARFLGKDSADVESQKDAERLEVFAQALRELGFEVSTHLGVGKPVPELARIVNELGPDLVILGGHGHRFLSDLIHGSTADALRHRVKASVLVVGRVGG